MSSLVDREPFRGIRVLVAEDDTSILRLYEHFFTEKKADVDLAPDGTTAWQHYQANPNYHLVITDNNMPADGDGLKLAGNIYTLDQRLGQVTPVIMISGTLPGQEERRVPNIVAYLQKPFRLQLLKALVMRHSLPEGREKHLSAAQAAYFFATADLSLH